MPAMTVQPGTATEPLGDDVGFERDTREVVGELRGALAGLIAALPAPDGGRVRRAADLQRTLEIGRTLAWQVYKVAHAADPLGEVDQVPKPAAMRGFFEAVARLGGREAELGEAVAVYDRFDHLVRSQAGSRSAFNAMASALQDDGLEKVYLTNRRTMFKAQSQILGIEADAHLNCFIYAPCGADDRLIDAVGLHGYLGLRRYRRDVGCVVSSMRALDDDGTPRDSGGAEPLTASTAYPGIGLVPEFCSEPLPEFRCEHIRDGRTLVEVLPNGIGTQSALTCLFGHVFRGAFSRYRNDQETCQNSATNVRIPSRVMVQDSLVHRGLFEEAAREAKVLTDHDYVGEAPSSRARDLLPVREAVEHIGRGPAVVATPDVPRYEQIVRFALDRLGWDPQDFDLYRCRIEYPIMPSSVVTQFTLREGP